MREMMTPEILKKSQMTNDKPQSVQAQIFDIVKE
jgi:hypothetical protein